MSEKLELRELTENDEPAFLSGLKGFEGEALTWYTFVWQPGMPHSAHLERLHKNKIGEDLPDGRVPDTMLYAFVGGEIIGRLNIRHTLNEYLKRRGGHIGYSVAPRFRRRGYATQMVRLCRPYCRAVGLEKVMLTCDDSNIASWKVLEGCGAKLQEKFIDPADGVTCRRYWLET